MTMQTTIVRACQEDGFSFFGRSGLSVAAGATLGMASGFGCLVLPSVLIAPLSTAFGWSRSELSLCYTLAAVGMAAGGVIWGRISDRVDVRYLLLSGGAFLVLPLIMMSQATALWQFYLANLLLGLAGFGCLYAPLVQAPGEWFDGRRGLVMGIVTAGGALGQGVMPYMADKFIAGMGWRNALMAIAAIVLVLQVLVGLLVRRRNLDTAAATPASASERFRFIAAPRVMALSLAAFLCCACMGVPLIHLAGYVASVCGNNSLGATSMLVAMVCGAVGRVCFGMIADRFGNLFGYASASLLQTVCVLAFPLLQSELPLLALSAVFGFGFAGNMTCLILCVRQEAPASQFGGAIGMVMFIAWAGMGVGGYLGGALYDLAGGYSLAFLISGAFGAANLVVLAALAFARRQVIVQQPV